MSCSERPALVYGFVVAVYLLLWRSLDNALVQIRKHDILFGEWGLGERHESGLGLAFNFAGPPGTRAAPPCSPTGPGTISCSARRLR